MALNAQYFVTGDLTTYFVDKDTGLPLAGGQVTFFRDASRTTPKPVYQLTGSPPNYTYTALPNPLTLSSVGTPQDSGGNDIIIYYFPFDADGNLDLYFVEIQNSGSVLQYTREAWPNVTSGDNPTGASFPIQNQIANPQFSQVLINTTETITYSVTSATNEIFAFAPDWNFVISGTGSVIVQRIPVAGNSNIITSPPYLLDVTVSAGITACKLTQTFNVNSGLWASTANQTIFLSGTFIAENQAVGTTGLQMFYVESTGGTPVMIVDASFDNSAFVMLMGTTASPIPQSTNTDVADEGFIQIYLSFLPSSHIRMGSVQVVPTTNPAGGLLLEYDLNSSNREQALMGDYYIPNLNTRPVPSLLSAWDFPLNPFQFAASGNITNTAAYICDQTIALCGVSGNVGFAKNTVTNGLQLTTAGSNDSFYLLQYLSGGKAKEILGAMLSVNVFGYVTSVSNAVTMRVYLCRAPSGSTIPTLPTSIGTVATNGVFTLTAAGWTIIPRSGLDTATAILPVFSVGSDINDADNDMRFSGWQLTDSTQISDTDKFAIVVTFSYIDTSTVIVLNSISVLPNAIPARPSPQSFDEVVRECQYYYEKSYNLGIFAGANSNLGAVIFTQNPQLNALNNGAYSRTIGVRYMTRKRIAVTPTIYAIDGTTANVFIAVYQNNALASGSADVAIAGNWTFVDLGETGFVLLPVDRSVLLTTGAGTGGAVPGAEALAVFHYVADARLGIV